MSPSEGRSAGRRWPAAALLAVLALLALVPVLLAACAIPGAAASFDASAPCTVDARVPGAYPALEARIPATFEEKAPNRLDSGRNCTQGNLGTLWDDGLREVRFAGGLWTVGAESGVTLAVFEGDGLTATELGAFYEAGARQGTKITALTTSTPTVDGRPGYRLDVTNDGRLETIVTWPSADGTVVQVALVASSAREVKDPAAHEARVQRAIAAFG
jgi:hypothetical protein